MSTYSNYDSIAKSYDGGRAAVASDLYTGALHGRLRIPKAQWHVLDAGCGTGNYSRALLDAGVGKLTLLDGSEGMLQQAKTKCKEFIQAGKVVNVQHHFLPTLPFPDSTFDCVMLNQVIHHLDRDSENRPNVRKFIGEAYRVLKPMGLLIINVSFPNQLECGPWYYQYCPKIPKFWAEVTPTQSEIISYLGNAGFKDVDIVVPTTSRFLLNGLDPSDILSPKFRKFDSFWELLTPNELDDVFKTFEEQKRNGTIQNFFTNLDEKRLQVGEVSLVFASKIIGVANHEC